MRHVSFLSLIILIAGLLPIRLQAIDFTDGIFKCSTGVENTAYIAGTTTKIFERITVPETVTDKSGKKYTVPDFSNSPGNYRINLKQCF